MSVEEEIFRLLQGLVSGRVFPDVAPAKTPLPYVTYQQIGGRPLAYLGNEVPNLENGVYQINVWAKSRLESTALAKQVESALLLATAFQARSAGGRVSLREPDLCLFGAAQDFSIWSAR